MNPKENTEPDLLDELEKKFDSKVAMLRGEAQQREKLQARLADLSRELKQAEDNAAAHQREAAANAALARELTETLRVASQAHAELAAALEDERRAGAELKARLQQAQDERVAGQEVLRRAKTELESRLREDAESRDLIAGLRRKLAESEAAAQHHMEEAERCIRESEQARTAMESAQQRLAASMDEHRSELEARDAEIQKLRAELRQAQEFSEAAAQDAAKAKAEAKRVMENAEIIQREGNEAMDAAQELKASVHQQAELRLQAELARLKAEFSKPAPAATVAKTIAPPPPVPARAPDSAARRVIIWVLVAACLLALPLMRLLWKSLP